MVVGEAEEHGLVEEGIPGDAAGGGAPDAFVAALGVSRVSSFLVVASDESGAAGIVEVLLVPSVLVEQGGAPDDFEAVPGVEDGASAGLSPLASK